MSSAFDPRRIFHWGYVVSDMDRALETWREQGSRMLVPPTVDPIQNVRCCLLIYRSSVPIELVAPMPEGPSPLSSRLRRGGGLDHVCIFTDDLEAELASFRDEGKVVVPPTYGAVFDRMLAFVATRGGLLVELMTRTAAGRASPDPLDAFFSLHA